jgi:hypothetical protein
VHGEGSDGLGEAIHAVLLQLCVGFELPGPFACSLEFERYPVHAACNSDFEFQVAVGRVGRARDQVAFRSVLLRLSAGPASQKQFGAGGG